MTFWAVVDNSYRQLARFETESAAKARARDVAEERPGVEFTVCRLVPVWSAMAPVQPVVEMRIIADNPDHDAEDSA